MLVYTGRLKLTRRFYLECINLSRNVAFDDRFQRFNKCLADRRKVIGILSWSYKSVHTTWVAPEVAKTYNFQEEKTNDEELQERLRIWFF